MLLVAVFLHTFLDMCLGVFAFVFCCFGEERGCYYSFSLSFFLSLVFYRSLARALSLSAVPVFLFWLVIYPYMHPLPSVLFPMRPCTPRRNRHRRYTRPAVASVVDLASAEDTQGDDSELVRRAQGVGKPHWLRPGTTWGWVGVNKIVYINL